MKAVHLWPKCKSNLGFGRSGEFYEKMKQLLKVAGFKGIPRGRHKATQANPARLTGREMDVLQLLNGGLQNKEIATRLFISMKSVDHHISAILYKLEVKSRGKAVLEAAKLGMLP